MDPSFQVNEFTPSDSIKDETTIELSQNAGVVSDAASLSPSMTSMHVSRVSGGEPASTTSEAAIPRDTDGCPKVFVSAEELTDLFNDTERSLRYDNTFELVDSPVSARPELLLDSVLKKRHIHGYRVRSAKDKAVDGDDNEQYEVVYEPIPWGLPGNDRWEDSYLCDGSRAFVDEEFYLIDRWWRFHPAKHDAKHDQPSQPLDGDNLEIDLADMISCPGSNHLFPNQARYIEVLGRHSLMR
nr:hypothetical protein B0A51_01347 [Rachicladosporium sp. CCFEE 5018]